MITEPCVSGNRSRPLLTNPLVPNRCLAQWEIRTHIRLYLLIVLASFAAVARAAPNPSSTDDKSPQIRGGTFVPNAGYIRTVREEQLRRKLAAQRPVQGAPPAPRLIGTRLLPVICVNFKTPQNNPPPFPIADYQQLLFGPTVKKTMTQYYADVSIGKLQVGGKVVGWYQLPKNDKFYENGHEGSGRPFGSLLQFALEKADAEIDFGQFDNDGPDGIPNSGDDDGKVDTVVIIHSDYGGECQDGTHHIWSHSGHYSDKSYGHSGPYVTRAVRRNAALQPKLGPGGPQHIIVDDYIIQPGVECPTDDGKKHIIKLGVFCHEYAHALGLPDLYDRTPKDEPDSLGAGNWCLMAGGDYGGDGRHSETPVSMSAWCKYYLGWAKVQTITDAGEIPLEPVEDRNLIYRMDVPDTKQNEYFLIEYRDKTWTDPGGSRMNWDVDLLDSGLAIWHVDERVGATIRKGSLVVRNDNWPFAELDKGQNDAPSLPNPRHTGYRRNHSLVALVEANGQLNLARGRSRGEKGDLWVSGMSFGDDATFIRGSRAYDGRKTDIGIGGINFTDYIAVAQTSASTFAPAGSVGGGGIEAGITSSFGRYGTTVTARPGAAAVLQPTIPLVNNEPPKSGQTRAIFVSESPTSVAKSVTTVGATDQKDTDSLTNINRTLKEADIEVADIAKKDANQTVAANLNQKLKERGLEKIKAEELAQIAKAEPAEINQVVEPDNRSIVQALGAESRTKELSSGTQPSNAAESAIVKLIQEGKQEQPATIQSAPEGTRVERVTDLAVPAKTTNIAADAKSRVTEELQSVIGSDIKLRPKEKPTLESASGTVAQFEQVVESGGKLLPVFGTETALYYSRKPEPTLTAITNKTVSADALKVTGVAGELSAKDAKAIVSKELNLDLKELKDGTQGVYIVDDNPQNARVVVMVPVRLNDQHQDINVFVDSSTKKVLELK
jgi:M6 family metalloprotease-like protein